MGVLCPVQSSHTGTLTHLAWPLQSGTGSQQGHYIQIPPCCCTSSRLTLSPKFLDSLGLSYLEPSTFYRTKHCQLYFVRDDSHD